MTDTAAAPTSLAIERVERSRGKKDRVRLRICARFAGEMPALDSDALLVVSLHGERHRFPGAAADGATATADRFAIDVTVPDWAVPEQVGQAVLWVGDAVVPVPPPGTAPAPSTLTDAPTPVTTPEAPGEPAAVAASGVGRSGPLSQLLAKETIDALHSELEQRSAEIARLRSALAQQRTDADGRATAQAELESAHAALRDELTALVGAVSERHEDYERRLADAHAERDAAAGDRDADRSALADARAELARARAEADDRLASERSDFDQRLAAARADADATIEAERARARSEAEATRAESEAMVGAAREDAAARAGAADAHARELAEQLATLQAAERHRADESSALREQLASARIARDAAVGEADGLRSELERLGSEIAVLREQSGPPGGDLAEARQLLADARALTQRLREEPAG